MEEQIALHMNRSWQKGSFLGKEFSAHLNHSNEVLEWVVKEHAKLQEHVQRLAEENAMLRQEVPELEEQVTALRTARDDVLCGTAKQRFMCAGPTGQTSGGRILQKFRSTSAVKSVVISPDSNHLVSVNADATMNHYDLCSRRGDCRKLENMVGELSCVAFTETIPEAVIVGVTSLSGSIYLWNLLEGEMLKELHADTIKEAKCHKGPVNGIDFHPGQQVMVTTGDDGQALIWGIDQYIVLRTLKHPAEEKKRVQSATFLGKDKTTEYFVGTYSSDNVVRIWDMRNKKVEEQFPVGGTGLGASGEHASEIIGMDYSPANSLLAFGSEDGSVTTLDVRTWKRLHSLSTREVKGVKEENKALRVAFSNDEDCLAVACSSGCAVVYGGMSSGQPEPIHTLSGHDGRVFDVAWGMRDGSHRLALAAEDRSTSLWSLPRRQDD
eukprot:TRINITY_DN39197_c0_g1_i1.p1 TRINITY_DN39197_c0_g1~~TRINITY_DN39197_c0_g1_i1.p1  ORF type:complete len:454 (+),score=70.87 TRINITY_DN39197_c0_g1_i1:51-1364(+)